MTPRSKRYFEYKKVFPFAKHIIKLLNPNYPVEWVIIAKGQSCGITKCFIDPVNGYIL